MLEIVIDEELSGLIPPLTEDEFARLGASILREGCRDAIILWGKIVVDGHNRYRICTKHNIPYRTLEKEFASREEVKVCMLENQLSCRNLNDFQRVEMVRKCEDAVKGHVEQRILAGKTDPSVNLRKGRATDELGIMAGVSASTYEHATAVLDKAPDAVVEATRKKELSINVAYGVTKLPEEQQAEIASRIEQGEVPKVVISDVKSKSKVESNSGNIEWSGAVEQIESAPIVRQKGASTNVAYEVTKLSEEKQTEISKRIEQVENPKAVISEVKKRKEPESEKISQLEFEIPLKVETRPMGKVINLREAEKKYEIIYVAPDWGNTRLKNEIYLLRLRRLISEKSILLMWSGYENIYEANYAAMQWGFKLRGAAFLWINKLSGAHDVQSKVCLLWTHGEVEGLDYGVQRLIESSGQSEKLAPDGMRERINRIYGEKNALEVYGSEVSAGWDVLVIPY